MLNKEQKLHVTLMLMQAKKLKQDLDRETLYQQNHIALFGRTHRCAEEIFASIISRGRALKQSMEDFREETKQDPFKGTEIPDTMPEDL